MADATLDVVINSIANTAGFATAKAELSALGGGGFSPLGGGSVNFGGSLSRDEQAMAAAQMQDFESKARGAAVAERDLSAEGNAVARAASSMGLASAEAGGRLTALGGVLGSSGAMGIGIGAAIVGLGGMALALKSMADISDKDEEAARNLANAYADAGKILFTKPIEDFINKNAAFITSTAAVKDGFAALARAGFDEEMSIRIMNDALDLQAAKHLPDLATAVKDIILAEQGQGKALLDLGINIKNIDDPMKELAKAHKEVTKATDEHAKAIHDLTNWEREHADRSKLTIAQLDHERDLKDKVRKSTQDLKNANDDLATAQSAVKDKGDKAAQTLDQIEAKTKDAKEKTSDLQQSQNKLNTDWGKFADTYGPGVNKGLGDLLGATDGVLGKVSDLMNFMSNDTGPAFDVLDGFIVGQIQNWQTLAGAIGSAGDRLRAYLGLADNSSLPSGGRSPRAAPRSTTMTIGAGSQVPGRTTTRAITTQ